MAHTGSRGIGLIVNFGTSWRGLTNVRPDAFTSGKETRNPLNKKIDGPHSQI